jgi:acyl-[acyl-carrier-protein]-phospholipid O-acyltransferase/long-chain-fatty-acid--[acyl-carrier-protein] ligase
MPDRLLRKLILFLSRFLYRIRVRGSARIPVSGGVLIIANHVSYIDALFVSAACPRPVRFLVYESFFRKALVGRILRYFGAIPVTSTRAKQALKVAAESLKAGEVVCIFPEGQLSRTGMVNEIRKGFELIARLGNAPVVPMVLDRIWGSVFSFEGGKFFFKWPRRVPFPVNVFVGPPVAPEKASPDWARDAFQLLGAEAYAQRPEFRHGLAEALAYSLSRHPWRSAVIQRTKSRNTAFTQGTLLALGQALGKRWRSKLNDDARCVGVCLPPGFLATVVHLGLAFAGKEAIDLPLDMGRELPFGLKKVIASRALWRGDATALVDAGAEVGTIGRLALFPRRCLITLMPAWLCALRVRGSRKDKHPTGYGRRGADGAWSRVILEAHTVLANASQVSEIGLVDRDDILLSAQPLASPEGQVFSLWFPLLHGTTTVSIPLAVDAARLSELITTEEISLVTGPRELAPRLPPDSAAFIGFEDEHPEASGVPVFRGLTLPDLGIVIALNTVDPPVTTDTAEPQAGSREGSVGRLFPGIALRPNRSKTALEIWSPALCGEEWHDSGVTARFDGEGFLFLEEAAIPSESN